MKTSVSLEPAVPPATSASTPHLAPAPPFPTVPVGRGLVLVRSRRSSSALRFRKKLSATTVFPPRRVGSGRYRIRITSDREG